MTPSIVKRFLISLDQHKWLGLFTFAFIVGASGVIASMKPPPPTPTYKAFGVLAFSSPPTVFTVTGEQIQQQGRQISEEFLRTNRVLEQTSAQVGGEPEEIDQNLEISLPENENDPQVIGLEYIDDNPELAATTLRALMQAMVDYSRFFNTTQLRETISSVQERLPEAKQGLQEAEQDLDQYIRQEGAALIAAQDGTLVGAITGSQQQQRDLQLQLEGIDAQINSLANQLGLTPEQAYTSSALSADPILANLRAQIYQNETQLEFLQERGVRPGSDFPAMEELRQQQQALETQLRERAAEVTGGGGVLTPLAPSRIRQSSSLDPARQELANRLVALQTEQETLVQQFGALRQTEQELRQQYAQLPNKEFERARLAQEVELQQALYDRMRSALVDAQAAEVETVSSLSKTQAPVVSEEEIQEPLNPAMIMGAGTIVGLLVAGGVILLLSVLDNKLYTPEELKEALADREVLVLGELPFIRIDLTRKGIPILTDVDSTYLPFYERFRSNLRRLGPEASRVIVITSIASGEGKSLSAYNLAIASAYAGKRTLLVEADLRSPSQAGLLNVSPDPDASVEPLHYYNSRSDCIRLVPDIENLYIVPSPGPQRQAAAIVESSELQRLLKDARGRFDMVVVDTPSLSRCNDALLIEPLTDGIVLVTRPGFTQKSMLEVTIDQFTEAELPLLGAVINGVKRSVPLPDTGEEAREAEYEELEKRGGTEEQAEEAEEETSAKARLR